VLVSPNPTTILSLIALSAQRSQALALLRKKSCASLIFPQGVSPGSIALKIDRIVGLALNL
jgi:hypothetical protein